jgi:Asp-tRNA(Asn)/Glu-tRNA(Gln) amidotransferase A subunit family amidase
MMPFEGAQLLADERYRHYERMGERTRAVMDQGRRVTPEQYRWTKRVQLACRQSIASVFEFVDVLLTPAAPGEAPEGLVETGNPTLNRIWSLTGVPCVTVPGLVGPHNMPIGVQVVGPMDGDAITLAAANWVHHILTR